MGNKPPVPELNNLERKKFVKSKESRTSYDLVSGGYVREISEKCNMDIPSDIFWVIFMFYNCMNSWDFKHRGVIQVKNNIITNLGGSDNTTLIGHWMDPFSDDINTSTIRIKIIKKIISSKIIIAIVSSGYHWNPRRSEFFWRSDGFTTADQINGPLTTQKISGFTAGDEIGMTLDIKAVTLSYILPNGCVSRPQKVDKAKYKWTVSLGNKLDCCEIIDISSS